jgi:hypothetical protein
LQLFGREITLFSFDDFLPIHPDSGVIGDLLPVKGFRHDDLEYPKRSVDCRRAAGLLHEPDAEILNVSAPNRAERQVRYRIGEQPFEQNQAVQLGRALGVSMAGTL